MQTFKSKIFNSLTFEKSRQTLSTVLLDYTLYHKVHTYEETKLISLQISSVEELDFSSSFSEPVKNKLSYRITNVYLKEDGTKHFNTLATIEKDSITFFSAILDKKKLPEMVKFINGWERKLKIASILEQYN